MSKPQFVYVTYIETTPTRLWEALTSSEFTKQYWFGAEVRSDWKIGAPFALLLAGDPVRAQEPAGRRQSAGHSARGPQQGIRCKMNLDHFKPLTVYTIYIAATPEKVWEALTSAEFSRKYFSGFAVEMEPRLGGKFVVRAPDGSEHISGDVFEYDPPNKLTVTWNVNWPDLVAKLGTTLVTYEIEQAGEAVRLTMSRSEEHTSELQS